MLVASCGGHWIELARLRNAFAGCDCQFVSTAGGLAAPIGQRAVLHVPDSSRDTLAAMVRTFARIVAITRRFDPHLVVSTGAAPGAVALYVAKLFGARTLWIDSMANSEGLSLSGRLVRPVADLRITQWEELATGASGLKYFGRTL